MGVLTLHFIKFVHLNERCVIISQTKEILKRYCLSFSFGGICLCNRV